MPAAGGMGPGVSAFSQQLQQQQPQQPPQQQQQQGLGGGVLGQPAPAAAGDATGSKAAEAVGGLDMPDLPAGVMMEDDFLTSMGPEGLLSFGSLDPIMSLNPDDVSTDLLFMK
jgi:hypothetical protein